TRARPGQTGRGLLRCEGPAPGGARRGSAEFSLLRRSGPTLVGAGLPVVRLRSGAKSSVVTHLLLNTAPGHSSTSHSTSIRRTGGEALRYAAQASPLSSSRLPSYRVQPSAAP